MDPTPVAAFGAATPAAASIRPLAATLGIVVLALSACSAASDTTDPLARGQEVFGRLCVVCHGERGQGGVGPALGEVVQTFPSCSEQMEWVRLGSERWRNERGATYGAPGREVKGGMPSMEASLGAEEIAAVAAFERSRFGEVEPDEALDDCGVGLDSG